MLRTQKIAIYGAGAIGCTLAARLILAGHQHVSLIARGENAKVLAQDGIYLKDLSGEYHVQPFQVVEFSHELEPQDYIFICTKFDALKHLTPELGQLLHENSLVIPLMNGIPFWYFYQGQSTEVKKIHALDPEGELIRHFPLTHLIGSVVFITAKLESYGRVISENPYLLIFGEPNHQLSERVTCLLELFEDTTIEVRKTDYIRDQIWTKVMANLSSNPLSVITGATLEDIYSHPDLVDISKQMLQEVRQVAASYGARISIDPATFLKLGTEMGQTYTSMWYDYQKGHVLELPNIANAVMELASTYGETMPMTKLICHLTQYLNLKNHKDE
ncbi:ketopantoate reductase PanE/ApbA [Acinetobacter sp. ANC 4558]|uniref:ketopantoate reductase family protein n=1 Tax=Acinetobacter sp. ANC 4558 TaxID=1977876 RepID=UPI000A3566DD|nr:2-dehydropantoate 2-reductase [Acinetobacter sp. ANC 4558]OTG87523.1 ketopantoate reductase PanE/ApbA [Acinetobacter sp. ANC 4558]